jgi:hypothetical protein
MCNHTSVCAALFLREPKTDIFAGMKSGTEPIFFGSGTKIHFTFYLFLEARFCEVGNPRKSQLVLIHRFVYCLHYWYVSILPFNCLITLLFSKTIWMDGVGVFTLTCWYFYTKLNRKPELKRKNITIRFPENSICINIKMILIDYSEYQIFRNFDRYFLL